MDQNGQKFPDSRIIAPSAPVGGDPERGFTLSRTFAAWAIAITDCFLRPIGVAHWHLDAERRPSMVGVRADPFPFKLGVVSFCAGVPVLLFSLWAGVLADRVPSAASWWLRKRS